MCIHLFQSLEPMRERILGLEKQVSDLERLKEAHQIIQQLRGELTWAMIEQREKVQDKLLILTIVQEYEQLLAGLDMRRNSVIGMQERISDGKASYEKLEAQIQDMEKSISEEQSRVESLMAHKNQVASQIRDKDHILNELKIDATSINVEFGSLKAQLEELNAKMQAELHTTSDKRQVKLRSRLSEIDVEQVRLSQQLCDSQDLEKQLTVQIGENEDIKCKMVEKLQETRQKALDYGERIKLIQSRMGNRVRAFGERMPEALAEIKRNKRSFGKNPVGPIGLVVGVKDRRWTLPLEAIIARNLDAFIVNDHQDRTLVQNILKKYGLSNPVIVLKFDGKLDISSGKPDSRYLTALDVLEINDPVVLKALVILCQIERQVLISDRQEAMGVIKSRPRSVDAVYTQAVRMNAGQKSVSASHLYKNPNVSGLAHDYEDALSEETKRLEQAAREQKVLGVELSKSEEKLGNLRTLLEEATQNINLTEQNLLRTNREARDLQLELRGSESISQSLYEQERTDMEQKMAAMEAQFQANEDQSSRIIDEHKTLTQRLQEFDTEITLIKTHHEEVLEEISNTIRTRKAVEREISNFENNIRLESHIISSKEDMLRQSSNELEEMRMSALQVCPRVHVSRTVQELDKELTANEECLRQNQNPNLDPLKIRQDLGDTRIQHRDAQKSIAVNERLVKSLRMALEQRQRAWEEFRRSVSKMSSSEFIFMLHSRGFQGSLEYKHHAGELEIKVIPQGQQSATMQSIQEPPKSGGKRKKVDPPTDTSENRDIKQLSGGEKSYSTACFLFSLWQAMGSPLRCLDEFDVYMVTWIDLVDIC